MITRDMGGYGYGSTSGNNPPPLHVRDTESPQACWYPLPRPQIRPQPPGPVMVTIPQLPAAEVGEDPTDPARQYAPRQATFGMVGRLNLVAREHNVGARGVRR